MKIIFILFFGLLSQSVFAQVKEDEFFVFDKDWKPASIKKAIYFLKIRQTDDSNYQWTTYKMFGPRIKQERFKDHNATLLNGKCSYYFPSGYLDSAGAFLNGSMDGVWYFYRNMDGSVFRQKNYENGMVVKDTLYPVITKADREKIPHKPGEIESEYPGGQNA